MMKRSMLALALVVALAGCQSNVKLPPDATQGQTSASGAGAGGTSGTVVGQDPGQSTVSAVQAARQGGDVAGPTGVGKVVYFDYDSFTVKPEYQGVVDQHARFLQANRARMVSLEGHTDERGSREYNLALGQKRAEAVRRTLTLVGVGDAQIEAVSFGEEKPAATGSSEDAYARNRRVEFRYR